MKKFIFILIIPLLSFAQNEALQPIGSVTTYVILCPCKLFKYYENGEMFYYCHDTENGITYRIKEVRHKKQLNVILNSLSENLFKTPKINVSNEKLNYLNSCLDSEGESGFLIDFMNGKAVLFDQKNEKKIIFSDKNFTASFEISITGINEGLVSSFFNKSLNSLMLKSDSFKRLLKKK